MIRRFEYRLAGSDKFWQVETVDHNVVNYDKWGNASTTAVYDVEVTWGRNGSVGQTQSKRFTFHTARQLFINEKIQEKRNKGYIEVPTSLAAAIAVDPKTVCGCGGSKKPDCKYCGSCATYLLEQALDALREHQPMDGTKAFDAYKAGVRAGLKATKPKVAKKDEPPPVRLITLEDD